MSYWILLETANIIVRSTVQPIPREKLVTPEIKEELQTLDIKITDKLGEATSDEKYDLDNLEEELPEHITPEYDPINPEHSMPEADEWVSDAYDQYISEEVRLPKNGEEILGQVISRKKDYDGNPIGGTSTNPILDTRLYQVMFPDGNVAEYSANVIAESLYSQLDDERHQYLLMDEIIDWKFTDDAIDDNDIL